MRLLLYSNKPSVFAPIKSELSHNYIFDWAEGIEDCLFLANIQSYQLFVLHSHITRFSQNQNLHLIKQLRKKQFNHPILVLIQTSALSHPIQSSKSNTHNSIELLHAGADDCLCSACSAPELHAHIYALLRRSNQINSNSKKAGCLSCCLKSKQIYFHHRRLALTKKQTLILECLIYNYPNIITKSTLSAYVWEEDWVDPNNIDAHLSQLKKSLLVQTKLNLIQTHRDLGYSIKHCDDLNNVNKIELTLWRRD